MNSRANIGVITQARAILIAVVGAASVRANCAAHADCVRGAIAWRVDTVVRITIKGIYVCAIGRETGSRAMERKQKDEVCGKLEKGSNRLR